MGKGVKRTISIILTACILCAVVCTQVGALCEKRPPETYEMGIFKIIKDKYGRFSNSYAIYDFTEEAKQQENLIIPCAINEKPLVIQRHIMGSPFYSSYNNNIDLEKSKIKKVHLVGDLSSYVFDEITAEYLLCLYEGRGLSKCHNLNKIIFNEYYFYSVIFENSIKNSQDIALFHMYLNVDYYLIIMNNCFYTGGVNNRNFYVKTGCKIKQIEYSNNNDNSLSIIKYGWWIGNENEDNMYKHYYWLRVANLCRVANIHFMYNYEDSPKYGYYWIDDIENGERIEVIPEEPTREGYSFGGWYTEPECVNIFDFNTPISKQEVDWGAMYNNYAEIPSDYITYLYAKWIEN